MWYIRMGKKLKINQFGQFDIIIHLFNDFVLLFVSYWVVFGLVLCNISDNSLLNLVLYK